MPAMRNRFPLAKHGKTMQNKLLYLLVQEHFQIPCWISVVDPCAFVDRWPRFLAAGHIFSEARGTGRGKLWKDCERFGKLDTGVRPVAGDRLMWILNDTEILRYWVNWNGHGPMVDICGHAQSHSVHIVWCQVMLTRLFESVDKEMPEFHLQANLVIFNAVLSSSEVSGDWCFAFRLLQDLQEKHLSKIVWQHLFMIFYVLWYFAKGLQSESIWYIWHQTWRIWTTSSSFSMFRFAKMNVLSVYLCF